MAEAAREAEELETRLEAGAAQAAREAERLRADAEELGLRADAEEAVLGRRRAETAAAWRAGAVERAASLATAALLGLALATWRAARSPREGGQAGRGEADASGDAPWALRPWLERQAEARGL